MNHPRSCTIRRVHCPRSSATSDGPGLGVLAHRRGHLFIRHPYYTISYGNYLHLVVIFSEESSAKYLGMEVNVERLKELRRERVLSLRELEERSGVSYNTIWRLEDGRQGAHPRTIRKLAEALGVAPSELIRGGDDKDG